jgi:hypothetical protein
MDSVDLKLYAGYVIVTIPILAREDFGVEKHQRRTHMIGVMQFRISEAHYGQFKAMPLNREIMNILFETFSIKYLNYVDYQLLRD